MNREQERLIKALSAELEERNLAIFAGAGLSRAAGFVDWRTLLKPIAEDLDLDADKEWDLVALAQYHANANLFNRAKLNQLLVTEFCRGLQPTVNHDILARLPIDTFWTTNYDHLIESSLENNGKIADVKYTVKQLTTTKTKRDAVVYKMHGDAAHPSDAVLTRDDYEQYHIRMQPFLSALGGDLVSRTILFLGFSFADPNLEYILSRVRIQYEGNQRQHHCILRSPSQNPDEPLADFEYRQRKESLFVKELLRVGIKVTYVETFDEITTILRAVEDKCRRRTIFISGAAVNYAPWTQVQSENFIFELSKEVCKARFRVISGFGLGVGSAVISGVLEQTIMNGKKLDDDQLILRPFPQSQVGERPLPDLWRDYRRMMLAHAGIAIFLFGNKLVDGEVVESAGMRQEFEIARENGVFIIPIGITESISRTLWSEVVCGFEPDNYAQGNRLLELLKALGSKDTTLEQAKAITMEIIRIL